ncbi:hypothetical protein FE257_006142 [Aspergillus nanangensis]|uniref:Beta-mannosidase A n=1 Tax=Aspergillus nanangensis TaxID=2582783 RepID=A0AAD4GV21_ASPNN|nr:hypothetical protein FE257_006142 [Aspergillus nanangensis]
MRRLFDVAMTVLASGIPSSIQGPHVHDLSKQSWTLSSQALNKSIPAHVPSQVHLDLFQAGVIDDPYYGLNDFNLRWIADANWTYTSDPITDLRHDAKHTWLVFQGLDTFATITFCGQSIASTDNQFRQYAFDVSHALTRCQDTPVLSLNFGSAPKIVNEIAEDPGAPQWPRGVQQTFEYPNRWFMRKEQSDFGWDWGPAFAPAGPWKPAYLVQLEGSEGIYVLNTDIDIYRKGQVNFLAPDQSQPWVVNASIDFLGSLPSKPSMSIVIADADSGKPLTSRVLHSISASNDSITGTAILEDISPELWWPYGLGKQMLYNITIMINNTQSETVAQVTKRTGFRTIFLNQRNITASEIKQGIAPGAHWHFEVNGHEFYAKGSNLIPPDAFWPRVTEMKMARLFDAVVAGNQNMLRVWSSGSYLHDFIYDLADERGILLWSEFQFGDAMYPVDDKFLKNVAAEVVYNVRRVNHHPSLALWAGGNEIESLVLPTIKSADPKAYPKFVGDYETLFVKLILPLVYENTRSISYSPSSTTEGYMKIDLTAPIPMTQRYKNLTAGHHYGDTDYYNYNTTVSFDYSRYPVGRFANEFGFHSMPSLQTWQQAVSPKDLHFNSSVIMLRNHHYPAGDLSTDNFYKPSLGMAEMTTGVTRYYPTPDKTDSLANFSAWCHATQLFQADFYKSQIQFYRRGSGMPERQLGSLYWQLEDIWQAPTWAGIEYDGRWKMLHYMSRDIYRPMIVSPFWNHTTQHLEVYVTSDLWEPVSGTVNLTWLDMAGKNIPWNAASPASVSFNVGALNTTKIYSTNIRDVSLENVSNSILLLSLTAHGHLPNSNDPTTLSHQSYFTPVFLKDLALVDPKLELSRNANTNTFTVEAKSGVALYTWLDYPSGTVGYFEDNGFILVPGEKREVKFVAQDTHANGEFAKGVTVQSLWDQTTKG